MIRIILLTGVLTLTSSCSGLGGAALGLLSGPAGDGINADAELTVGKKEEAVNVDTQLGDNATQTAQTINNVNDIPLTWILLFTLMAGWAIPDPQQMGRGVLALIRAVLPWSR